LRLGGVSTYTGNTAINNGIVQLTTGNNRLPTGTVVSLGQAASANVGTLDLNSRDQQIFGLNSTTGTNATASNNTVTSVGTATLTIGGTGTYSYGDGSNTNSGIITGAISLVKQGSGTQTLGDANTYTGTTTISAGKLTIASTGTINGTGAVLIGAGEFNYNSSTALSQGVSFSGTGGTLSGTGIITPAVTITSGNTLAPGNSPGTLTTGALTWNSGGNYNWQLYDTSLAAGTGWDLVDVSGALDIAATSVNKFNLNLWTLSGIGPDVNGDALSFNNASNYAWKIAGATSITGFAADKFAINTSATNGTSGFSNALAGGTFSVAQSGNDLNLVFTTAAAGVHLYWSAGTWGATASGTGGNGNWADSSGSWDPSKTANFAGTAGAVTATAVTANKGINFLSDGYSVSGGTITLSATAADNVITVGTAMTATISSALSTSAGITKSGAGTLIFTTAQTYTGGTAVAGTLQLGDGTTNNGSVTDDIANSGTVAFANPNAQSYGGVISGTGAVTKTGAGNLTLTGMNTFSGGTTISAGTLTLGNATDTLRDTGAVAVSGGTLAIGANSDTVGAVTLSSGGITGSGGTLTAASYTATNAGDATISADLAGAGGLSKSGAGALTLSGTNSYTGTNLISAGTVKAASSSALGASANALTLSGTGALDLNAQSLQVGTLTGVAANTISSSVAGAASLTATSNSNSTFAGNISDGSGTVALTKAGTGALTLSGTNGYTGGTALSSGNLIASSTASLPTTGTVAVSGDARLTLNAAGTYGGASQALTFNPNQTATAALDILSGADVTWQGTVALDAATRIEANGSGGILRLTGDLSGNGALLKQGAGNLILSGAANSATGGTTVGNGTLTVSAGSSIGTGALSMSQSSTNTATLALNESVTVGDLSSSYSGSGASGGNVISIASTKTLTINQAGTTTYGAPGTGSESAKTSTISGSGGIALASTSVGTLTVSGTNTFSGGVTVDGGELKLGSSTAIASANALSVTGTGTVSLNGNALEVSDLSSASTTAVVQNANAANATLTVNKASGSSTFDGLLQDGTGAGTLALSNTGAGTLTLTGTNTYTGGTSVSSGTVLAASNSALGTSTTTLSGGNLRANAGVSVANNIVVNGVIGTIAADSFENSLTLFTGTGSGNSFLTGNNPSGGRPISSPYAVDGNWALGVENGSYTITSSAIDTSTSSNASLSLRVGAFSLTSSNGLDNTDTITLQISADGGTTYFTQALLGGNSNATWAYDTTGVVARSYAASDATITNASGGGVLTGASGLSTISITNLPSVSNLIVRITGLNNTANEVWALDNFRVLGNVPGNQTVGGDNTTGTATYTGTVTLNNDVALTAASGGTVTFTNVISGSTGSITKTGAGTVDLSGDNTYTGTTLVSTGTLLVNGDQSASTGDVTVAVGATLGGIGTIGGDTIVNGTLSTGALATTGSVGTLTLAGVNTDLTFANGSMWLIDLMQDMTTPSADRVTVGGTFTVGASDITFNTLGTYFEGNSFTLASYTSRTGFFDNYAASGNYLIGGNNYYLDYGATTITLTAQAVPEPAAFIPLLPLLLAGLWFVRRRKMQQAQAAAYQA